MGRAEGGGAAGVNRMPPRCRRMLVGSTWSVAEQDAIRQLRRRIRPKAKDCYAVCQRMLLQADAWGWTAPRVQVRVQYADGLAISRALFVPVKHAWLLLNGRVWDPSWEQVLGHGLLYIGRVVPVRRVRVAISSSGWFGPILSISPDVLQISEVVGGEKT